MKPNLLFNLTLLILLAGCASKLEPNLSFTGSMAPGEVRGEYSDRVLGTLESKLIQVFPKSTWILDKNKPADVKIDLTIFSARTTDSSFTQELKNCRRWSEPKKDAQGWIGKAMSRECLDWEIKRVPCVSRKYEMDVQFRARSIEGRLLASDRKVISDTDQQCDRSTPSTAALQASVENEIAIWAVNQLRNPLTQLQQTRPVIQTLAPSAVAPAVSQATQSIKPVSQSPVAMSVPVEAYALVIGNSSYPGSARLTNPTNDSRAISKKLSSLGFQVTVIENGDRDTFVKELTQFQKRAANSQVTVLFYSGHGMQLDGVNYLIPVNIDPGQPNSLKLQSISMNSIIDSYLPGKTRIVFLDACRDNPLVGSSTRGYNRGLAPMQVPSGTLIAYATKDGGVAEDGKGQYSPFTQALLDYIDEPEDIALVLRKVRERVMQETGGRQQPWDYGSLTGGSLILSRLKTTSSK